MVIEHDEWVGADYKEGWAGQQIAIVGFSHWLGDHPDDRGATRRVIEEVCHGDSHSFFDQLLKYFGAESHPALWSRVIFFNYLPDVIGREAERYGYGTAEQHARARDRFMDIIGRRRPNKLLVFSKKAWGSLPALREQRGDPNAPMLRLSPVLPASFAWGTYEAGGHVAAAFGLRHSQGANQRMMRGAVQTILDLPIAR